MKTTRKPSSALYFRYGGFVIVNVMGPLGNAEWHLVTDDRKTGYVEIMTRRSCWKIVLCSTQMSRCDHIRAVMEWRPKGSKIYSARKGPNYQFSTSETSTTWSLTNMNECSGHSVSRPCICEPDRTVGLLKSMSPPATAPDKCKRRFSQWEKTSHM